eukprot:1767030-Prymnesium_polylepis.2
MGFLGWGIAWQEHGRSDKHRPEAEPKRATTKRKVAWSRTRWRVARSVHRAPSAAVEAIRRSRARHGRSAPHQCILPWTPRQVNHSGRSSRSIISRGALHRH